MFICMFDRMVDPNNNILENDLQRNDVESIPTCSINQNSPVATPEGIKKLLVSSQTLKTSRVRGITR